MLSFLVLTVVGPDRPGLVRSLAACIADHGGNWLESRMCRLGGQFAGILRIEVPVEKVDLLLAALPVLVDTGLEITIFPEKGASASHALPLATIEVIGQDRPGILLQVTGVLAGHGLNVEDLSSERIDAPMAGGTLFKAHALVSVPATANLAAVRLDLEKIAADLMVDVQVKPLTPA